MIPVNRDTLSIIALVVCVAGILFLFREVNKTKQEVEQMKDFSDYVSKRLIPRSRLVRLPRLLQLQTRRQWMIKSQNNHISIL